MDKPLDEALFEEILEEEKKDEENICYICMDVLDLPYKLPCKHEGHYNCLMGVQNRLCPLCRAPIPREITKKAEIDIDVLKDVDKLLWMYKARSGRGWWFFEANISKDIES